MSLEQTARDLFGEPDSATYTDGHVEMVWSIDDSQETEISQDDLARLGEAAGKGYRARIRFAVEVWDGCDCETCRDPGSTRVTMALILERKA